MSGRRESDPEAHQKLQFLIAEIQPVLLNSKQKKRIKEFAQFFKEAQPYYSDADIAYMLWGADGKKGLLQTCGNSDWKAVTTLELKASAEMALQLVSKMLLDSDYNPDCARYLKVLSRVDLSILKQMQFAAHLRSERVDDEHAYRVMEAIEEQCANISVSDFVEDADARKQFEQWREGKKSGFFAVSANQTSNDPTEWSQVVLESDDFVETDQGAGDAKGAEYLRALLASDDDAFDAADQDPLGLIDSRTMRVRREDQKWKRGSATGASKDLLALDGDDSAEKLSHTSAAFDSAAFLAEIHNKTSFLDLQRGLQRVRRAVTDRTQQMRDLVSQHFDQFVQCADTIDMIHQLLAHEVDQTTHSAAKQNANQNEATVSAFSKTARLQSELQTVRARAEEIYRPMLSRKNDVDKIQHVLSVLHKFQFLLSLPGIILQATQANQYDKVIRAYKKAKSIVVRDVDILQRVHSEVYAIISTFRQSLLKKLDQPTGDLEEHIKIIGYLLELDCEEDPAWYCLRHHFAFISGQFDRAYKQHVTRIAYISDRAAQQASAMLGGSDSASFVANRSMLGISSVAASTPAEQAVGEGDDIWQEFDQDSGSNYDRKASGRGRRSSSSAQVDDSTPTGDAAGADGAETDHSTHKLIKALSRIMSARLPDFWKLAEDVGSGRFARAKAPQSSLAPSVTPPQAPTHAPALPAGPPLGPPVGVSVGPPVAVAGPPVAVAGPPTSALAALHTDPSEGVKRSVGARRPDVKTALGAVFGEVAAAAARAAAIRAEARESDDATERNVLTLVTSLMQRFADLVRRVILPPSESRGRRGSVHPAQPLVPQYEALPASTLDNVCMVLHRLKTVRELEIPSDYVEPLRVTSDELCSFFVQRTWNRALHLVSRLWRGEDWAAGSGGDDTAQTTSVGVTQLPGRFRSLMMRAIKDVAAVPSTRPEWIAEMAARPFLESIRAFADCLHTLAFEMPQDSSDNERARHRKLLAVLANCIHTRSVILPEIWSAWSKFAPKSMSIALQLELDECSSLYTTLESLVFAHYVRSKTLSLNSILKQGLLMCGIDWSSARAPREIRSYVMDALLELVFVHEEVNTTAKGELEAVMKATLEKMAQCMLECIKQIDSFNHAGALQILVEVDFIKHTLTRYLSLSANRIFSSVEALLTPYLEASDEDAQHDAYAHEQRKELLVSAQTAAAVMFECFA